jgi:orotate phosphoribosyltransferase-like protein
MTSFREFLGEKIYVVNDEIKISYATFKDDINKETEIDNYTRPAGLYKAKDLKSDDTIIFSLYLFDTYPETMEIIKSLKKSGKYSISEKTYDTFLKSAAERAAKHIKQLDVDVIVYPKSSSNLVVDFIERLQKHLPKITFESDVFVKKKIKNIENAADKVTRVDVSDLIDVYAPHFEKLSDKSVAELERALVKVVNDNIKSGEDAVLTLKRIYKHHAKFFINFLEISKEIGETITEKNVLVMDDVLASGITTSEMIRMLEEIGPKKVTGLTLFKSNS